MNQIKNNTYKNEIDKLWAYYQDFTSKIPDTGKQEVVKKAADRKNTGEKVK